MYFAIFHLNSITIFLVLFNEKIKFADSCDLETDGQISKPFQSQKFIKKKEVFVFMLKGDKKHIVSRLPSLPFQLSPAVLSNIHAGQK